MKTRYLSRVRIEKLRNSAIDGIDVLATGSYFKLFDTLWLSCNDDFFVLATRVQHVKINLLRFHVKNPAMSGSSVFGKYSDSVTVLRFAESCHATMLNNYKQTIAQIF